MQSFLLVVAVTAFVVLAPAVAQESRPASDPAAEPAPGVEAISLLGKPLTPMPMDAETRADREAKLTEARIAWEAAREDETTIVWYGRRLAYLGRYRDAIDVYTRGLAIHPESAQLLRHRGHRYISTRKLTEALVDLERAAQLIVAAEDEVEADGMPNEAGVPTSTLKTNIWYHLALAHYLRAEYTPAAEAWRRCLELSQNDDMRCAASYWLYLAETRSGRAERAADVLGPIHADMTILENHAYHRLLLLFKGELAPDAIAGGEEQSTLGPAIDDATTGYGLGAWHLVNGREDEAVARWQRVLAGPGWAAFGYIAAEAEIARRATRAE
jgi:tetratricopeptide (TPR) repeat protein